MDYSETIEVYDIKVGIHSKLNEYKKIYICARGQGHSLTFSKVTHISLISNRVCPEATGQTEVNLHTEPS